MATVASFDGNFQNVDNKAERGVDLRVLFRSGEQRICPDCGSANWLIGRRLAECGSCGTAVPLAEVALNGAGAFRSRYDWWRRREARSHVIRSGASFSNI